ncbi:MULTISPECIES: LysR substrate-binding domain-containing protein [Shewanella]|jgi:DNA-binding transcriptional LysR family regulator|uniref:LysR substrate-binding domain-containing protein n=1 Tax=Shewanella TaxID=22 RepID=UPI001676E9F1|nr:LysR substrate-binding domain-containing protein [Shewanella fodinae]MCL2907909.1 LysR substrate-binding domain-containing protein [Shewanella fodinae]GGZ11573.1 LysR family transcriptional regulator [Shewanella fodinae]
MDLKVIRYFIEIVDHGGFAKAAEAIHLTQPALSKAINQLEEELDLVLLERGKRGSQLKPTASGEVVYRYGIQLLKVRQEMHRELEAQRSLNAGELHLGLAPLGSAEIFAPVIARYRSLYPKIAMQLFVRGGIEQTIALKKREVELATGIISFDEEFEGFCIRRNPMVVVVPKQHALANQPQLTLKQLEETPQILFDEEYALHELVFKGCVNAGFIPKVATKVSHPDFGITLVAAGTGVMIMPEFIAARHAVAGVSRVPLSTDDLIWELSLFWRKGHPLSFAAQAMVTLIREQLAAEPV